MSAGPPPETPVPKKYSSIYAPTDLAVIHSYSREIMSGCGRMIQGSDSHIRYSTPGTMAAGKDGCELAKQLVGCAYDVVYPEVVAIYLTGSIQYLPEIFPLSLKMGMMFIKKKN